MSIRHALTIPQVLLVAALLVGCSSTKTIEVYDDYREINKKGSLKRAQVFLDSGERIEADGLRIDADSTSFIVVEEYVLSGEGWSRRVQRLVGPEGETRR